MSPSTSKKQKNNSQNKENANEIILIDDDDLFFDHQIKVNQLAQEKLLLQKQANDELEREIMLLEKRNHILGLKFNN